MQKTHTHTPNIHALSAIRTHDRGFRASETSTCLRPLGYRDRPIVITRIETILWNVLVLYVGLC
jgi:hypothetical protein